MGSTAHAIGHGHRSGSHLITASPYELMGSTDWSVLILAWWGVGKHLDVHLEVTTSQNGLLFALHCLCFFALLALAPGQGSGPPRAMQAPLF